MIIETLGASFGHDAAAWAERSMALASRITAYLTFVLRPAWQASHGAGAALRYDDGKLTPERRREIAAQLQPLLGPGFAELVTEGSAGRESVWAVMLTDSVLNEIGQDLLDSPVVYAADIARAVDRVSDYLREAVAARPKPGEDDLLQSSSDILSLIVQEACPYYLVKEVTGQGTQSCTFQELAITEDRLAALPREVAAFVREKSRQDGPKQYGHLACSLQQVEGVYVVYGTYDDVRIFWSGPFTTQARDNYVYFHPLSERAREEAGSIWILCDWIDETVAIGFGREGAEERIRLSDLVEEGRETLFVCQLLISGAKGSDAGC
ncbi:MAG: hypothetical protein ACREDR_00330 [Blastocatellia bacterium]